MEEILKNTLLYDFYGELLTENQKNIYELYYLNDLSLGEISGQLGISRQGVYDTLKRCEKTLGEYEERLKLLERFLHQENTVSAILECIHNIEKHIEDTEVIRQNINTIKHITNGILKE